MSGRNRIAAVKRAREKQARIEAATVRVAQSQQGAERARDQRRRSVEMADAKVADREREVDTEVGLLVDVCGSTRYAADVLGLPERQVRQMVKRQSQDRHSHDGSEGRRAPKQSGGGQVATEAVVSPSTPGRA
jgi:hypothetical protein